MHVPAKNPRAYLFNNIKQQYLLYGNRNFVVFNRMQITSQKL